MPSRIVHLPLSWNDPATQLAQAKYMQSVRPDAPWCPDNIEFIRRINGLDSVDEVHRIVHEASYLVLGLGDVYLGAPVATPLDPRHRLVTTKYNPARTWTPENAVGIGGAYMCVYGMEGPGGYQLVGRTVQVWNTHRVTPTFVEGCHGRCASSTRFAFIPCPRKNCRSCAATFCMALSILASRRPEFNLARYEAFLDSIQPGIAAFKERQTQAFQRGARTLAGEWQLDSAAALPEMPETEVSERAVPEGCEAVHRAHDCERFSGCCRAGPARHARAEAAGARRDEDRIGDCGPVSPAWCARCCARPGRW